MRRNTFFLLLFVALFSPAGLLAEKLAARPLEGAGDYEFMFFAADRHVEIDVYLARIREIDAEATTRADELKKLEAELKNVEGGGSGKRSKTLEWSPIENVAGYSVKIYNGQKELIGTHKTSENSITLELEEGSYYFQVAATTKLKTGTYSHMSGFRVTRGKHSPAALKLEDQIEIIHEKDRIATRLRADYIAQIKQKAGDTKNSDQPVVDTTPAADMVFFLALEKKSTPPKVSDINPIPGRENKITANTASPAGNAGKFIWGAGVLAGIQQTNTDFFRMNYGLEGFLRYDKAFLQFLRPQLKLQTEYSPSKSSFFDAMIHTSLYVGIYYPFAITQKFSILPSIGTGVNNFLILASAGSSSVLQWGFMPAVEFQYALMQNLSLYLGGAINMTYDTGGKWLSFIPFNLGVTGRF